MKLISFSLWGSHERYCKGAIDNVKQAPTIYNGWKCRFYYRDVPTDVLEQLRASGAETVECSGEDGMFWRFRPASDPNVERFISRDTDSIVNWRERAAVDEWIKSGKKFHIMRDHYYHGMPMMGGMWGCLGGALLNIDTMIAEWAQRNTYNDDQLFLERMVWPIAQESLISHDSCPNRKWNTRTYSNTLEFPKHRKLDRGSFVGEYT